MKIFRKTVGIFKKIKRKFWPSFKSSCEIYLSKGNLLNNFKEFKRAYPGLFFAPVLKSNAYGHGLLPMASILDKEEKAFFVVDSIFEAEILRNNGIESEILVAGYTRPENIRKNHLPKVAFIIIDLDQLREVSKIIKAFTKIHLKIDTGMHRQGILPSQIPEALSIIQGQKKFLLEGICSHFADADGKNAAFTKLQIKQWETAAALFKERFSEIKFFHIAASAGTYYSKFTSANTVRLGIGLYGINPSLFLNLSLKPVLEMRSLVGVIKNISAGEFVGYNCAYQAKKDMKLAIIPVGYFEGVDRRLFNRGGFKIKNQYCPLVGKISMNISAADVSSLPELAVLDPVTIISAEKGDLNSLENIAKTAETIPYEILAHLPQHLRRVIVD